jgi:hypothetical protein
VRDRLGIAQIKDKRSGKMVWGWPAKVDHLAKQLPETSLALQLGTSSKNRAGQGARERLIGYGSGVKVKPVNRDEFRLNRAYEAKAEIDRQVNDLSQQNRFKTPDEQYTPEGQRARDQQRHLEQLIYELRRRRGDKILPSTGAPPASSSNPYSGITGGGGANPYSGISSGGGNPYK